MAKTITDAAILLGQLESASPDPDDPATRMCTAPPNRDYTLSLTPRICAAPDRWFRGIFLQSDNLPGRPIAIGGGLTEFR